MADYPIYVTLQELHDWGACTSSYRKLMRSIDYDKRCEPANVIIPLELILDVLGPCDTVWAISLSNDLEVVSYADYAKAKYLGLGEYIGLSSLIDITEADATAHLRKWLRGRTRNG